MDGTATVGLIFVPALMGMTDMNNDIDSERASERCFLQYMAWIYLILHNEQKSDTPHSLHRPWCSL